MLEQLFENGAAKFRPAGQETIHNRSAYVYNFEITRELSRWRIEAPSQLYYPAMKGSVWIDKETSRVLRIEQQGKPHARAVPLRHGRKLRRTTISSASAHRDRTCFRSKPRC